MTAPDYRRIVVKVSGEAFGGDAGFGISQAVIDRIAQDLVATRNLGIELAVVVGGGNLFRGIEVSRRGVSRPTGDAMGMLATVMNCLALAEAIERAGAPARVLSAVAMPQVCPQYSRPAAIAELVEGRIVLLAGGTGNPFFTTDTTAVLRGAELGADAVFKATNVDGIYTADPKKDPSATRYDRLTHDEAVARDLKVMDATAFALAREQAIPIVVFSIAAPSAIASVAMGQGKATVVSG